MLTEDIQEERKGLHNNGMEIHDCILGERVVILLITHSAPI